MPSFFFFFLCPVLVLTTMNKTLLLCAGFLWNDLAQVCSLKVLPRSSAMIWSYNNWMFAQGEISWQVIFPPQQYHLQLFPYIQCHWKVCPSERLWMVCFHFQHSNFHLEVKVRLNHVLVKYHNIQFHSRFRECFITFLNQMSSWSERENGGIFNVSPYFILEQINLLILQREVVMRKATETLVLVCQWHQSARKVKTAGAQSCRCYSGKNPSDCPWTFCLITSDWTASGLGLCILWKGTVSAGLAFINKKDVLVLLLTCLFNCLGDGWGSDSSLSWAASLLWLWSLRWIYLWNYNTQLHFCSIEALILQDCCWTDAGFECNWGQSSFAFCFHLLLFFLFCPLRKQRLCSCVFASVLLSICSLLKQPLNCRPIATRFDGGSKVPELLGSWLFDQSRWWGSGKMQLWGGNVMCVQAFISIREYTGEKQTCRKPDFAGFALK